MIASLYPPFQPAGFCLVELARSVRGQTACRSRGLSLDLTEPGRYAIILDRDDPTLAKTSTYTLDAVLQPLP